MQANRSLLRITVSSEMQWVVLGPPPSQPTSTM